jgi:predicted ATPase
MSEDMATATPGSEMTMIESIEFSNFKALRKTTLPLAPFTLLLGPNGSGKTTVLQALRFVADLAAQQDDGAGNFNQDPGHCARLRTITVEGESPVEVKLRLRLDDQVVIATFRWHPNGRVTRQFKNEDGIPVIPPVRPLQWLKRMQTYSLDPAIIALPHMVSSQPLQPQGAGLAAVLDDLKDNHPDRWEMLLAEMRQWLPEYDYVQFDKPNSGSKGIVLRTKKGGHRIPARDLSHGTLVALALLTLAYLPDPPSLVGLEEIDRGLHPRLLRHLQDALYRLSYPASCGETRPPIQVIATTHSPYLLDLYREHPEEIVLAQKQGLEVEMKRLKDVEHFEEILGDSPLSEVWYSGVLGGVSVKP